MGASDRLSDGAPNPPSYAPPVSTLRELAAESIGRITRRGLEPQIAQIDAALRPSERAIAVAPGHVGAAGTLVVVTNDRLLISAGAPFTKPTLAAYPLGEVASATAGADGSGWALRLECGGARTTVTGMFDRDALRIAALASPNPATDS